MSFLDLPFTSVFTLIILGALFIAGFLDFLYYKLPNKIFYFLILLFLPYLILTGQWALWINFLLFLTILFFGFILFQFKIIGGGDVKIFAASILWVGWADSILYLTLTTLMGALIGLYYLWFKRHIALLTTKSRRYVEKFPTLYKAILYFVPQAPFMEDQIVKLQQQNMIPYGLAIVSAAIIILGKKVI